MGKIAVPRLWEVRIIQVPFTERAPAGCLQYHTGSRGIIQTLNFAENGRRLADQDYNICTRQELGMCSISYEPCHENAFRIGAGQGNTTMIASQNPQAVIDDGGMNDGQDGGTGDGQDDEMNDDAEDGGTNDGQDGEMDDGQDGGTDDGQDGGMDDNGTNDPDDGMNDVGSGNGGLEPISARQSCSDRIVMPCSSDELIAVST